MQHLFTNDFMTFTHWICLETAFSSRPTLVLNKELPYITLHYISCYLTFILISARLMFMHVLDRNS